MKGRALRRALETADAYRIGGDVPLIVDTTELITPDVAYELLLKNTSNRPIDWKRVEEYAAVMRRGEWALHAQGIVLDTNGNLLTGQKRLWAVIYSNTAIYMRVSRGSPPQVARLLDRGTPQTARDLATRGTGRKHSPVEASLARAVLALKGNLRPSTDALSQIIETQSPTVAALLQKTAGTKKSRAVLMVLAAIASAAPTVDAAMESARRTEDMADRLEEVLQPHGCARCWGKGALFSFAMEKARIVVWGEE